MQVITNKLATTYSQSGKGKNVLLLHGWGDSSKGMAPLVAALAKDFKVTLVDLPGFGGTQAPDGVWGLTDYANFVTAFCDKIQLKPYAVVGHSNGGAIAIRALNLGLRAERLVLVASAGIRGEYKGRLKVLRYITKAGKLATAPLPKSLKKKLRRKVYTTVGSDMLVAEHLQETFKKVVTDDVRTEAGRLALPTLLVYGDADASTPLRYGELLHKAIPNSQLLVIPGGDHWLPTENTTQLAESITEFLG